MNILETGWKKQKREKNENEEEIENEFLETGRKKQKRKLNENESIPSLLVGGLMIGVPWLRGCGM